MIDAFASRILSCTQEIHDYATVGWIYRGQPNAQWLLSTSLERCCDRQTITSEQRIDVERELLREFRRAYHQYSNHPPASLATIEWLALMQHHGAPTRLLDFSYSIYIAMYFAIEHADSDAAIWALNGSWAMRHSAQLFQRFGKSENDLQQLQSRFTCESEEVIVHRLFMTPPFVLTTCPLNSFRSNERLRIQKGVFVVPGAIHVSFMENLLALPGHDDAGNIIRLIVPKELRSQLIRELYRMNISRTSLFPGLDGFSQSLGVYHPVFSSGEPIRKGFW